MERLCADPISTLAWGDGKQAVFDAAWYAANGVPLPPASSRTDFHSWDYPPEPNGLRLSAGGTYVKECCAAIGKSGKWFDWDCGLNLHLICEIIPPAAFERWHQGGARNGEPNNALCDENCGALRLDLLTLSFDHSAIKDSFWNDYHCESKYGFVCETVLPSDCAFTTPLITFDCVRQIVNLAGCNASALNPTQLQMGRRQTVTGAFGLFRQAYNERHNYMLNMFPEMCGYQGSILTDSGLEVWYLPVALNYFKARDLCKTYGALLPAFKNEALARELLKKLLTTLRITGVYYWWIGLDDVVTEGTYLWSTGEEYDIEVFKRLNWTLGGWYIKPHLIHDCLTLKIDTFKWDVQHCSQRVSGAVCVKDRASFCPSFHGPHTDVCLIDVWNHVGCVPDGHQYPTKIPKDLAFKYKTMIDPNLMAAFQSIKAEADAGNATQQLNCYGVVLSGLCSTWAGPHSKACLEFVWKSVGCTTSGLKHPDKLSATEFTTLAAYAYGSLFTHMQTIRNSADSGVDAQQIACFGEALPSACPTYYGPHSLDCLNQTWIGVGCRPAGHKSPEKRTPAEQTALSTLNYT
uniref:Uncharacterized protein LOC100184768 n=1 Tax=Phallusia mammillata TaxID=59560 RepID=A0A6F9DHF2_9ASCI|nr:uncharacterized protein LOC100184768 [Phallusia mammillata]